MPPLPYLNGIRAFEAAARGGGFAQAARELNVSQAAISRMVRLLEQRLDVILFERRANGLVLTAAGRAYQTGLTPLLAALSDLTERIRPEGRPKVLTVGVGPTFAIRWLIPRLAAFRDEAPDIEVRITTGGAAAPYAEDWTCGIRLGVPDGGAHPWPTNPWPANPWREGLTGEPLFPADLVPVCAPALAARLMGTSLTRPEALTGAMLLRVAHAPGDWPSWLAAFGLPGLEARGPVFEFYGQALQAATDGLGLAPGLRPYVDDDLAAGRLVAPFPLTVPKGAGWHLIYREARLREPAFAAFRSWLMRAARGIGPPSPVTPPASRASSACTRP